MMIKSSLLLAPLAFALAACQSAGAPAAGAASASVAAKIDAGVALAAADLPKACQIVGEIAAIGAVYAAAASVRASSGIAKATSGAAALANSPLCQNPASADPVAASIEILNAVAAVKAATQGGVSAASASGG
jgi:hypothetical protein